MKRGLKNIIIIILVAVVGAGAYFAMDYAADKIDSKPKISMNRQDSPPQMPGGDSASSNNSGSKAPQGQPPEKPGDNSNSANSKAPDSKKSALSGGANNSNENSGDTNKNNSGDGQAGNSAQSQPEKSPEMPANSNNKTNLLTSMKKIATKYYLLFAVMALVFTALVVYLAMSEFNKKRFKETLNGAKRIAAFIMITLVISAGLTFGEGAVTAGVLAKDTSQTQMQGAPPAQPDGQNENSVEASGKETVKSGEKTLNGNYSSSSSDESAILVTGGAKAAIDGATIKKTGDSSSTESSEFSGVNAGVLVQKNSSATIKNANISTDAEGANAVFSTGEKSKINISNSTITTSGSHSARGLDATYGGTINADKVKITTKGGSCAALATDRGEGTVAAKNSSFTTGGSGSPVIYSTGNISIESSSGKANGSQMVVIEGKNSASVKNSFLSASGVGNRNNADNSGIMIYQSMSGDAGEGTGTFSAENSSLSINKNSSVYKSAPMFFVTNTNALINLTNTSLSYGSDTLLSAKGTNEWGTSGQNGGIVSLNAKNQKLFGNIEADKISSVTMKLENSSYEGTINSANSAKSVKLTLDKSSKITLTGDSYVSSLSDADTSYSNINLNGHTLFVNGKALKK